MLLALVVYLWQDRGHSEFKLMEHYAASLFGSRNVADCCMMCG